MAKCLERGVGVHYGPPLCGYKPSIPGMNSLLLPHSLSHYDCSDLYIVSHASKIDFFFLLDALIYISHTLIQGAGKHGGKHVFVQHRRCGGKNNTRGPYSHTLLASNALSQPVHCPRSGVVAFTVGSTHRPLRAAGE